MGGNEHRRRVVTADERDVHGRWRHIAISWTRAGMAAYVKRRTRRRERREGKRDVRARIEEQ